MKHKCINCSYDKNGWCLSLQTNNLQVKKSNCWDIGIINTKRAIVDQIDLIEKELAKLKTMMEDFKNGI